MRSRTGPTSADQVEKAFGHPAHFEVVAHSLISSLFLAKDRRDDVELYVVLEGKPDPPRAVRILSSQLYFLAGFDERTVADVIRRALAGKVSPPKDSFTRVANGLSVGSVSFERIVRGLCRERPTYLLSRKGEDIRCVALQPDPCFLITDHVSMQKKTLKLLTRVGVQPVSVGPRMLFAAHCISVVHNELDRQESTRSPRSLRGAPVPGVGHALSELDELRPPTE